MEPCHSRADCGSNQECVGGRCHCQPGFRADDNKHCMPLSLSCQAKVLQCDNDPTNVPSTGNVPERYKCLFKAKYMSCLSSGSKGCSVEETSAQLDRLSDEYGIGPCEAGLTQECTPGIICTAEHASCHLNLCMCDKDFYTLDGLTCNPKKPFNAECSADVECLTHGACRQSMCTCADHFRLKGGRCVDIPAGNTCSERNVTRACGTNQFCKEQRCVCATRFTSNPVTSLCVAKTVGSSCLGDADCGPHQVCANSFCACDTYYAVDITTSLCSPVMVGDVCAGDDNCGVAQSCSQGFCQCRSGYSLPQGTVICVETAPPEEENRGTALSSTTLTLLWTLAFLAPLHVRHLL